MNKSSKGFSLIEVLVAMVILSFALTAAIQSFITVANNTNSLRRHHIAYWVGSNYLATQVIDGSAGGSLTSSVTTMAGKDWFVDAKVVPTMLPQVEKILVQVFDQSGDSDPIVVINGYKPSSK